MKLENDAIVKDLQHLVICTDGTWNQPDHMDGGRIVEANVVKVTRTLASYAKTEHNQEKIEQRVYYDTGIGVVGNNFHQYLAGAFGIDLRVKVKQA